MAVNQPDAFLHYADMYRSLDAALRRADLRGADLTGAVPPDEKQELGKTRRGPRFQDADLREAAARGERLDAHQVRFTDLSSHGTFLPHRYLSSTLASNPT